MQAQKNPDQKTQPEMTANDVIYFEHNAETAQTAQSIGITTYFYDHTKEDMDALKQFLDENL